MEGVEPSRATVQGSPAARSTTPCEHPERKNRRVRSNCSGYLPAVGRSGPAGISRPARPGGHRSPRLRLPAPHGLLHCADPPKQRLGSRSAPRRIRTPSPQPGGRVVRRATKKGGPPGRPQLERLSVVMTSLRQLNLECRAEGSKNGMLAHVVTQRFSYEAPPRRYATDLWMFHMFGESLTTEGDPVFRGRPRQEPYVERPSRGRADPSDRAASGWRHAPEAPVRDRLPATTGV